MEKEFIPYEQALKLKELGFDEICLAVYFNNKFKLVKDLNINNVDLHVATEIDAILAPLWQQVVDWFREKYSIFIEIKSGNYFDTFSNSYQFHAFCKVFKNGELGRIVIIRDKQNNHIFQSYENAREQATLKAIALINENMVK